MMSMEDLSLDDSHTQILKAHTSKDLLKNDRISDLSDDILIHILSSLTLKEAGSTSLLSKRWRNVWTYVSSLNFCPCYDYLKDLKRRKAPASEKLEKQREEENKYVRWVDAVMSSHEATIIDEFRVRFYLKENWKENIDNWLRIATEKRVRRLQLNIAPIKPSDLRRYCSLLNPLSYNLPSLSPGAPLTSLELNFIDVTGDTVEKLLHDIPTLEFVSIMNSRSLISLKVSGPGLNLKSLKLIHCMGLEQLEISAPNLISFDYAGPLFFSSPLISTPKLAELSIQGDYGYYILGNLMDLSSIFSQIDVLCLKSFGIIGKFSKVFPSGRQIKRLVINFSVQSEGQLLDISSLIFCCPLLQKFVFEVDTFKEELDTDSILWCQLWKFEEEDRSEAHPHRHLKIVEMTGSSCTESELRFLKYITKHAVSLEKLIIKPGSPRIMPVNEARIRAKERAEQWRTILKPAGGHLEII